MKKTFGLLAVFCCSLLLWGCSTQSMEQDTVPNINDTITKNSATDADPVEEIIDDTKHQELKNTDDLLEEIAQERIPTPSQTEGPYYPVAKPDDRDENLRLIENSTKLAKGTPIKVYGTLLGITSDSKEGYTIEIRQTDDNGIYMHPNDPREELKDKHFQSYGEIITNEQGVFYFETILPGYYENRPRHIHFKVKYAEKTLLTSQLYFHGDERLQQDGIFTDTENNELLVLKLYEEAENNVPYLVGKIDVVIQ